MRFDILLLVTSVFVGCIAYYELILEHKDASAGWFDPELTTTGLENENDPSANTYSIIGNLNPVDYILSNGKYQFKLIYVTSDNAIWDKLPYPDEYEIIWQQSTWLTSTAVSGYEAISVPAENTVSTFRFVGVEKSPHSEWIYLGGTSGNQNYRNAIGYFGPGYYDGVPSFNGISAKSTQLFVFKDNDATSDPTRDPTSNPTIDPNDGDGGDDTDDSDCESECIDIIRERIRERIKKDLNEDIIDLQYQIDAINAALSSSGKSIPSKSINDDNDYDNNYNYNNIPLIIYVLIGTGFLIMLNVVFILYLQNKNSKRNHKKVNFMDSDTSSTAY